MRRSDGGAAFPTTTYYDDKPVGVEDGMSLRDYFAAAALPEVFARAVQQGNDSQESICQEAYELADSMLEARVRSAEGAK